MVKGISRQVILIQGPGEELFDQAIFILKNSAVEKGVTEEDLMKEARRAIRGADLPRDGAFLRGPLWACGGAAVTGLLWLVAALL